MRSYFVGAVTIAVVIISISTSLVEGRIGSSSVEVLRRMIEDEEADMENICMVRISSFGNSFIRSNQTSILHLFDKLLLFPFPFYVVGYL